MKRIAFIAFVSAAIALIACSMPESDPRFVLDVPERVTFPAVADLMNHSCGTLDCHGTMARNLRVYGHEGMRLSGRPSSQANTTAAEYDESYLSLITLEPEVMSTVVAESGAHPERLTLIRKGRGMEHHKGGALMREGDSMDLCVTSWLKGSIDAAACADAKATAF